LTATNRIDMNSTNNINLTSSISPIPTFTANEIYLNSTGIATIQNVDLKAQNDLTSRIGIIGNNGINISTPIINSAGNLGLFSQNSNVQIANSGLSAGNNLYYYANNPSIVSDNIIGSTISATNAVYTLSNKLLLDNSTFQTPNADIYLGYFDNSIATAFASSFISALTGLTSPTTLTIDTSKPEDIVSSRLGSGTIHIGNSSNLNQYSSITINTSSYTNGTTVTSSLPAGMQAASVKIHLPVTPVTAPNTVTISDNSTTVNTDTGTITSSDGQSENVGNIIATATNTTTPNPAALTDNTSLTTLTQPISQDSLTIPTTNIDAGLDLAFEEPTETSLAGGSLPTTNTNLTTDTNLASDNDLPATNISNPATTSNDTNIQPVSNTSTASNASINGNQIQNNRIVQSSHQTTFGIDKDLIDFAFGEILVNSIVTNNSEENEFMADALGVVNANKLGYHPAGLEGFLLTIKKIEENSALPGRLANAQVSSLFTYRHPDTLLRLEKVEGELDELRLKGLIKSNNLYRSRYNWITSTIQK